MALRMRTWLAVVGTGVALVSVAALPPGGPGVRTREGPTPERRAAIDARREVDAVRQRLRALRLADSVEARMAAAGEASLVTHAWDAGDAAEPAAALREAAEDALARLPSRSATRLGLFLVPPRFPDSPEPGRGAWSHAEVLRGEAGGRPYCAVVHVVPQAEAFRAEARPAAELLGPCAWLAAYGEPGAGVEAWLDDVGYGFLATRSDSDAARREVRRVLETAPRLLDGRFGARPGARVDLAEVEGCRGGSPAACRAAVLEPLAVGDFLGDALAGTPLVHSDRRRDTSVRFGPLGRHLVADLEAEHGPEAFARFWTSDRPLPEAFEAAFGEPLPAWVERWTLRAWAPIEAGPGLGARELLTGLLWAALSGAVAVGVAVRRRVG